MKNIIQLVHSKAASAWNIPVIKAVATSGEGVDELIESINKHHVIGVNPKRAYLLAEKAYRILQSKKMKHISKQDLQKEIEIEMKKEGFNLYKFVKRRE